MSFIICAGGGPLHQRLFKNTLKLDIAMRGKVLALIFSSLFFFATDMQAQNQDIRPAQHIREELTGKVLSTKNQEPVAGATIRIKGTTRGVAANEKGIFSISIARNEVIVVTAIGFKKEELKYQGQSNVRIYLDPDIEALRELVVVGYGTEEKRKVIGSVSSVEGEELNRSAAISFDNALAGQAAGVLVNSSSGVPGSATSITIRGISALTGDSNNPLIVIDGVPVYGTGKDLNTSNFSQSSVEAIGFGGTSVPVNYSAPAEFERNPLANLNPNDIASVEILKDAYATSIYGSRGAAGVILITTKKGSRSDVQIDFNSSTGIARPIDTPNVLNGEEFSSIYERYFERQGYVFPSDQNTDWIDAVTRRAITNKMDFSATGGSDELMYYLSGSFLDQPSYIINQDFTRYTARSNLQYNASDIFQFGSNISISYTNNEAQNAPSIYRQAILRPPNIPIYKANGDYEYGLSGNAIGEQFINPVAQAQNQNEVNDTRTIGNAYLEVDPGRWITLKSEFGIDFYNSRAFTRRRAIPNSFIPEGEAIETLTANKKLVINNTANFQLSVGADHLVEAVLGQSFETSTQNITSISSNSFPDDDINSIGGSNPNPPNGSATRRIRQANQDRWALASYFTRINYDFRDKYLLGFSYRIDGSSRFSRNNRYVGFPAFSAGWRISNESFMENITFVDDLKLRASLGVSGINSNAQRSYYGNLGQYQITDNQYAGLGVIEIVQPPNPNLQWQRKRKMDVGLDFTLFGSTLNGAVDYYYEKTTNMLYTSLIPTYFGFSTQQQNIGDMQNQGIELTLRYNKSWSDFQWVSNLTMAANRNKILNLNFENEDYTYTSQGEQVFIEGQPATTVYLFDWAGIDPATGDPLWRYDDGSLSTTPPSSLFASGNENIHRRNFGDIRPDFYGGLTNTFYYKGIELSARVAFSYGNKMINGSRATLLTYSTSDAHNLSSEILNYWRIQSQETDIPRLNNNSIVPGSGSNGARDYSASRNTDRFLEDASYARLKNLTVAYTIPPRLLAKVVKIRKLRFYFQGTNLYTLTNYSGIDPEVSAFGSSALLAGRDELTTPQNRIYEFGINIGF